MAAKKKVAEEQGTETARVLSSTPSRDAFDNATKAWVEAKGEVNRSSDFRNEKVRLMHNTALTWASENPDVVGRDVMGRIRANDPNKISDETASKESAQWNAEIGAVRRIGLARVLAMWPQKIVDDKGETTQATITVAEFRSLCVAVNSGTKDNVPVAEILKDVRKATRTARANKKVSDATKTLADVGMKVGIDPATAQLTDVLKGLRGGLLAIMERFPQHGDIATEMMARLNKLAASAASEPPATPQPANDPAEQKAA